MSRQELAEAVNAWLWHTYGQQENLTYRDVAALERGEVRWPGERRREAFRAVLGAGADSELGFYINRPPRTVTSGEVPYAAEADLGKAVGMPVKSAVGAGDLAESPTAIPASAREQSWPRVGAAALGETCALPVRNGDRPSVEPALEAVTAVGSLLSRIGEGATADDRYAGAWTVHAAPGQYFPGAVVDVEVLPAIDDGRILATIPSASKLAKRWYRAPQRR